MMAWNGRRKTRNVLVPSLQFSKYHQCFSRRDGLGIVMPVLLDSLEGVR
jgi:hypothetical protein